MAKLTVESAKDFLKSQGYFVDNLWSVNDVKKLFEATDEEAQKVLENTFKGEYLNGEINETIRIVGNCMDLELIEDED